MPASRPSKHTKASRPARSTSKRVTKPEDVKQTQHDTEPQFKADKKRDDRTRHGK